jgi:hypothetical protein
VNALNTLYTYTWYLHMNVHINWILKMCMWWYQLHSFLLIIEFIALSFIIKYPKFSDISSSFLVTIEDCTAVGRSEQLLHSEHWQCVTICLECNTAVQAQQSKIQWSDTPDCLAKTLAGASEWGSARHWLSYGSISCKWCWAPPGQPFTISSCD